MTTSRASGRSLQQFVVSGETASDLVRITQTGSGNALVVEDSANPDSTPFVVNASGNVGIGGSPVTGNLEIFGASAARANLYLEGKTSDADGSDAGWIHFRNPTAITGNTENRVAIIATELDGSTATKRGGRISLWTKTDNSEVIAERMRIDNAGQITVGLGSASAPVLSFSGDTNTGLWSPGADAIAVSTAGSERLRIDNAGNVGIGTSSPDSTLHVSGASATMGLDNYTADTVASANIRLRKARGTMESPSAALSGDFLGSVSVRGYGATGFGTANVGLVGFIAAENFTDSAQGTSFVVGTTPTGSTTRQERMRIDNAGLITGTGTSLGAWTAYTPTLGGTGWAIGNGTAEGKYCQVGKIVHFRASVTFGSTSTYGAAAAPTITLPVTAVAGIKQNAASFGVILTDTSLSAEYSARCLAPSTSTVSLAKTGTDGVLAIVSSTVPFTWASTDVIVLSGTYEAA